MPQRTAAGRWVRSAIILIMLPLAALTWVPSATANNVGAWFASENEKEITRNYGGDNGFNTPTVTAAKGEIVLNRTAEQGNIKEAGVSGSFRQGLTHRVKAFISTTALALSHTKRGFSPSIGGKEKKILTTVLSTAQPAHSKRAYSTSGIQAGENGTQLVAAPAPQTC
jgi:hypothetical protein